jgi:hypothetical protein
MQCLLALHRALLPLPPPTLTTVRMHLCCGLLEGSQIRTASAPRAVYEMHFSNADSDATAQQADASVPQPELKAHRTTREREKDRTDSGHDAGVCRVSESQLPAREPASQAANNTDLLCDLSVIFVPNCETEGICR